MELVSVLRVLARRRLLVALGVLAAAVVGYAASGAISVGPFGASEQQSTVAYSQIQIDTPKSLLVDLEVNSSAIGTQTVLLADRMPKSAVQAEIARTAGIRPEQLTVLPTDAAYPARVSPLATRGAEVASTPRGTYLLEVSATTEFPIISVAASGPDRRTVRRLAEAPTTVLRSLTDAGARTLEHQLSVKALAPVVFASNVDGGGHGRLLGLIVFVTLSALWCGALVIATGIARSWRVIDDAPVAV